MAPLSLAGIPECDTDTNPGTPGFRVFRNPAEISEGTGRTLCSQHTREFRMANPAWPRARAEYGKPCEAC